jgi:hypothetical protein
MLIFAMQMGRIPLESTPVANMSFQSLGSWFSGKLHPG